MTDLLKLNNCGCGGTPAFQQVPNHEDDENAGGQFLECAKCGVTTNLRFACGDDPKPLLAETWNKAMGRTIAAGSVVVPVDFVRFLLGSESHDGVWFHDLHPTRQGRYWWRNDLQAMLAAAQVSA